jgi:hypothetical protein
MMRLPLFNRLVHPLEFLESYSKTLWLCYTVVIAAVLDKSVAEIDGKLQDNTIGQSYGREPGYEHAYSSVLYSLEVMAERINALREGCRKGGKKGGKVTKDRFAIIKDVFTKFTDLQTSVGGQVNEEEFREFIEFSNDYAEGEDSSDYTGVDELLHAWDKISKMQPAKSMIISLAVECGVATKEQNAEADRVSGRRLLESRRRLSFRLNYMLL